MDYDDLFLYNENDLIQNDENNYDNDYDDEYIYINKKVKKHNNKISSNISKYKNNKNLIEHNDKIGYVFRYINNKNIDKINNKNYKGNILNNLEYIDFFKTSCVPGSNIKNAISGNFYPYLVGSSDEKLLFKIALCTGEKGTLNYSYIDKKFIAEQCPLYYDSPEQYERHMNCEVSINTKNLWLNNKNLYITSISK